MSPSTRGGAMLFPKFAMVAISFVLATAVQGLVLEVRATPALSPQRQLLNGVSPVITAAPQSPHRRQLMEKAVKSATCGFVDGNARESIICEGADKCTLSMTEAGCCIIAASSTSCDGFVSKCFDFTTVGTKCSTCTDSGALYCSDGRNYPWCVTLHYPSGILDFICDTAPATLNVQLSATTTYNPLNHDQPIPSVTGTPVTTLSSQGSPTSSPSSPDSSSSGPFLSGLTIWQVALIAVGGFLFLLTLVSCCCWRSRKRTEIVYVVQPPPATPELRQGYPSQQTYNPNK